MRPNPDFATGGDATPSSRLRTFDARQCSRTGFRTVTDIRRQNIPSSHQMSALFFHANEYSCNTNLLSNALWYLIAPVQLDG
jgi:hypothetical protein